MTLLNDNAHARSVYSEIAVNFGAMLAASVALYLILYMATGHHPARWLIAAIAVAVLTFRLALDRIAAGIRSPDKHDTPNIMIGQGDDTFPDNTRRAPGRAND